MKLPTISRMILVVPLMAWLGAVIRAQETNPATKVPAAPAVEANIGQTQELLADRAYDAFPAGEIEQSEHVSDGTKILDFGITAFLAFPRDARAEKTINSLALLPQKLSKTDLAVYEEKFLQRTSALLSNPNITGTVKEGLMFLQAGNEMAVQSVNQGKSNASLVPLRRMLDKLEASHLDTPWIVSDTKWLESTYGDLLTDVDPNAAKVYWEKIAANGDQELVVLARGKLNFIELKQGRASMQIRFTAADGRQVDLTQMRGKVVLIVFWATWCPPCLAELPEIKKAYETYHSRGLEIIGISCEYAGISPDDADDVRAKKLEQAKAKLLRFTARQALPWPQYYDGKGLNQNDYAFHFGVAGIPMIFVLDQNGKLIDTKATDASEIGPLVNKLLTVGTEAK